MIASFFQKYFPPSSIHAALQRLFDFKQGEEEKIPESWTRFCALIHAHPGCPLPNNELVDIYYNGLTNDSRTYLDSFDDCVFMKRTPIDAEELMAKISKNYDDWTSTELIHLSLLLLNQLFLNQFQHQQQRRGELLH